MILSLPKPFTTEINFTNTNINNNVNKEDLKLMMNIMKMTIGNFR